MLSALEPLNSGSRLASSMSPGHCCAQRLPIQCAGMSLGTGRLKRAASAFLAQQCSPSYRGRAASSVESRSCIISGTVMP
jgi:hypothetical protein